MTRRIGYAFTLSGLVLGAASLVGACGDGESGTSGVASLDASADTSPDTSTDTSTDASNPSDSDDAGGLKDADAADASTADAGLDAGGDFDAASDAGDGSDGGADAGVDAGPPDPKTFEENIVFVTSTTTTGALGGIQGADTKCQDLATAAGLPGSYKAWVSTSQVDARDRLTGSRGWVRPDGLPFADTISDLTSGKIAYPAVLDEHGIEQADTGLWTGTTAAGTNANAYNCEDWTSDGKKFGRFGLSSSGGSRFTDNNNVGCSVPSFRLLCFGTGKTKPVVVKKETGRRAFVSAQWTPSGGIAGADAKCQSEATAAGLTGTYLALLAQDGQSPRSRFEDKNGQITGAKWVRTDGLIVSRTAAGFFSGTLLAPIFVHANGVTRPVEYSEWAGSAELSSKGKPSWTCSDWNPGPGSTGLLHGLPDTTTTSPWGGSVEPCATTPATLFCLEK